MLVCGLPIDEDLHVLCCGRAMIVHSEEPREGGIGSLAFKALSSDSSTKFGFHGPVVLLLRPEPSQLSHLSAEVVTNVQRRYRQAVAFFEGLNVEFR